MSTDKDIQDNTDKPERDERKRLLPFNIVIGSGAIMLEVGLLDLLNQEPTLQSLIVDGMAFISAGGVGRAAMWLNDKSRDAIIDEVRGSKTEIKDSLGEFKTEIKDSLGEFKTEIKAEIKNSIDGLRAEVRDGNKSIVDVLERIEKKLPDPDKT